MRASSTMSRELARIFDTSESAAQKAGDSFVTVERLLLAAGRRKGYRCPVRCSAVAALTPQALNAAINEVRKGRTADIGLGRTASYDALKNTRAT